MTDGHRLALGTAQLGQRYGVTNRSGPPAEGEVQDMLALLRRAGADTLDTAIAYGDSEVVLGNAGVGDLKLVTKLPPLAADVDTVESWVRESVERSLRRLGVRRLHGLLLHRPADVFGTRGGELLGALAALKDAGLVAKLGASVYAPDELDRLQGTLSLDIVQAPYSVLDRRFALSGWFERLRAAGTEIHVRSVFLQGLLLLQPEQLPSAFSRWRPVWERWCEWVRQNALDNLTAALGFVLRNSNIARVVVGAESSAQLSQIIASARALTLDAPSHLAVDDLDLINPVNWTLK